MNFNKWGCQNFFDYTINTIICHNCSRIYRVTDYQRKDQSKKNYSQEYFTFYRWTAKQSGKFHGKLDNKMKRNMRKETTITMWFISKHLVSSNARTQIKKGHHSSQTSWDGFLSSVRFPALNPIHFKRL